MERTTELMCELMKLAQEIEKNTFMLKDYVPFGSVSMVGDFYVVGEIQIAVKEGVFRIPPYTDSNMLQIALNDLKSSWEQHKEYLCERNKAAFQLILDKKIAEIEALKNGY